MTKIAVAPKVLKNISLKIDVDNYEAHVSSATLTPNVSVQTKTWKGLDGGQFTDQGTPDISWTLNLDFAQDWETLDSLSQYLLENAKQTKTVVLAPEAGTGEPSYTIDAVMVPGPIGGQVDEFATGTVALPCVGDPVPGTLA